MMTYETYKDSGIEWLGDVPEYWKNYRIDWVGSIVRGNTGFKKDELLRDGEYVALQYGKTYKVDEVNNKFNFFVNSGFYKKSQTVNHGDTILISTSETIEDLGHSCFYNRDDLGLLGGEQLLFKPNNKLLSKKYLYYYSKKFSLELRKYATGLKVFRFNSDDLKQISIAIPQLEEQKAIAQYLDTKTQAIDKKVELLEQKIGITKICENQSSMMP
jgi:type I restriction enzyme S subunit